jgi:NDP-sugar pyrophosphorylase family protein
MSGLSSRFTDAGYTIPKHLIEIDGKRVIEHIINLYPEDSEFVFIINDKHAKETDVVEILHSLVEDSIIITIDQHKKGPVHTVLEAKKFIDDDEQVIVNYCDFSIKWDYDEFKSYVDETQYSKLRHHHIRFHQHMT